MSKRKIKGSHIILLLLGLLAVAFGVFRITLKSALRHRTDAIRAAGEPLTLAELDASYAKPVFGENAADYIVEAFIRLRIPEGEGRQGIPLFGNTPLPPRTQPLDEQTQGLIDKLLAENAAALELLHRSTPIEQSRYPADLTRGNATLLPHISEISKAARLLAMEAVVHAGRDRGEAAAKSVIAGYALARSLLHEPLPISQTVRYACDNMATQGLEQVLNRVRLADPQLAELDRALQTAHDPNALSDALVGQRCFFHDMFRRPQEMGFSDMGGSRGLSPASVAVRRATGLLDKDWIACLYLMGEYIQDARLPVPKRLDASRAVEAKLTALPPACVITRHVLPSISRLIVIDLVDLTRLDLARTAVAVERYRLAKGQRPQRLADLVPTYLDDLPLDPFDGQSLRYRPLEQGYLLYSIGRDERDSGGQERRHGRAGRDQTDYDITFTVER